MQDTTHATDVMEVIVEKLPEQTVPRFTLFDAFIIIIIVLIIALIIKKWRKKKWKKENQSQFPHYSQ